MSAHLFALEPGQHRPWRGVRTIPLIYTDAKRCGATINPKRPTWRCKEAPTVLLVAVKTGAGMAVCRRHVRPIRDFLRVAVPVDPSRYDMAR